MSSCGKWDTKSLPKSTNKHEFSKRLEYKGKDGKYFKCLKGGKLSFPKATCNNENGQALADKKQRKTVLNFFRDQNGKKLLEIRVFKTNLSPKNIKID